MFVVQMFGSAVVGNQPAQRAIEIGMNDAAKGRTIAQDVASPCTGKGNNANVNDRRQR